MVNQYRLSAANTTYLTQALYGETMSRSEPQGTKSCAKVTRIIPLMNCYVTFVIGRSFPVFGLDSLLLIALLTRSSPLVTALLTCCFVSGATFVSSC